MGGRQYPLVGGSSGGPVGGLLTTTIPYWSPLKPAASPHASSDYFDDASLAGAWSTWDPGSTSTVVTETADDRLKIVQPTHSGDKLSGIFKAVPAGTRYSITAALHGGVTQQNVGKFGIFVSGNLASSPTTAGLYYLCTHVPGFDHLTRGENWSKYDTLLGTTKNASGQAPFFLYRIFVDTVGNKIYTLLSVDGRAWHEFDNTSLSASGAGASPTHMGIAVDCNGTGNSLTAVCSMFRIDSAAAATDRYVSCGGWVSVGRL